MELRPYQKQDFKLLKKSLKQNDHVLFSAATGYGKSSIIYNAVKKVRKKYGRVLVIAPRRKLVNQLFETLSDFIPSIVMGSDTIYFKESNVFVASTATMHNRLKKYGKKYFGNLDIIIIDEVHINFGSSSMDELHKLYWNKCKWVGLSATPIDDRGYRLEGWDDTIYEHQTKDLINLGWLSPVKVMVEDTPKGLSDLNMVGGDYAEGDLADFMMDGSRVSNVYEIWNEYARDRKTMIFAVTINHANMILEDFLKHNVKAAVVHSNIDENAELQSLSDFKNDHVEVLINVGKLTTGYDEPSVDALIIARPTKSLRLFLQIIGRALRVHKALDYKLSCLGDLIDIKIAFIAKKEYQVNNIKRQLKEKGITNVDVFPNVDKVDANQYAQIITDVEPNKEEALILDIAGTIEEHGYPTMKRDFNKVRPPKRENNGESEFAEIECFECEYSTQIKNCKRLVEETKDITKTSWYCPNCNAVIKETIVDNKEVKRLKEIQDYSDISEVTGENVKEMIFEVRDHKGYKQGWVSFISKDYKESKSFRDGLKLLYKKWSLGMINISTVLTNINKIRE